MAISVTLSRVGNTDCMSVCVCRIVAKSAKRTVGGLWRKKGMQLSWSCGNVSTWSCRQVTGKRRYDMAYRVISLIEFTLPSLLKTAPSSFPIFCVKYILLLIPWTLLQKFMQYLIGIFCAFLRTSCFTWKETRSLNWE